MKGRTLRNRCDSRAGCGDMDARCACREGQPGRGHRVRAPAPPPAPASIPPARPHEIPADVIVRAFVKAEAGALHLVVRVPLTSMRDVDFPVRGPGYVEIGEATELLADQAKVWIADYVTLSRRRCGWPRPS